MNASIKLLKQRRQMEVSRLKRNSSTTNSHIHYAEEKNKNREGEKITKKLQSESERLPGYDLSGAKE
jgi:hypothetical protein